MKINRRRVRITVSGTDAQGDTISLTTHGTICDLPVGWILQYEETDLGDMATALTLVQVEGQRITVTRSGTMLSTLVFDARETFVGDYPTPAGSFRLRVLASQVDIRRKGDAGHIRVVYQVGLSSALSTREETDGRTLDIRFFPAAS